MAGLLQVKTNLVGKGKSLGNVAEGKIVHRRQNYVDKSNQQTFNKVKSQICESGRSEFQGFGGRCAVLY